MWDYLTQSLRKSRLIQIPNEVPLAGPTLLCIVLTQSLCHPVCWSICCPESLLSASRSHTLTPSFWKLTLLNKISNSLSPSALPLRGPSWPYVSLYIWELDHSLPFFANDSLAEKISLSGCYPCPSTARNLLNQIFLLRTSHFRKSISWPLLVYFRNDPQAPSYIFLLDNQRPRLTPNQRLKSFWFDLHLFLEVTPIIRLIPINIIIFLSLELGTPLKY